MIAVFLHIVFTGGGKDEKRKDFTANPVCFGFGHGLLCFRSNSCTCRLQELLLKQRQRLHQER